MKKLSLKSSWPSKTFNTKMTEVTFIKDYEKANKFKSRIAKFARGADMCITPQRILSIPTI